MNETEFPLNRDDEQVVRILIYDNCNNVDLKLAKRCRAKRVVHETQKF